MIWKYNIVDIYIYFDDDNGDEDDDDCNDDDDDDDDDVLPIIASMLWVVNSAH
jgi:hypothetical protein